MKICVAVLVAAAAWSTTTASAQQKHDHRREAAAHVHGSGKLNIVIENNKITIGLDSPANDILGFETKPKTPEQTAKLDKAVATLKDSANVFAITAEAGCTLAKSDAGFEPEVPAATGSAANPEEHADFAGTFEFDCKVIAKLKRIDLTGFFAAFPSAGKLDITLITTKGQTTRSVSKKAPRIDLTGAL
jgi:hypothetical protein